MRRAALGGAIALVCALYLADLAGMGMIGPDEPRYAEIGREMARSGDWITPHLWGEPWFEKPALLYWMAAAGFRAHLSPDLAPRLPVALVSLAFLAFFWRWMRDEWDDETARCAVCMLATSAGWLAYSHNAVTDLPLAVFFSAAVMLAIATQPRWVWSAISLALATLAKGLVPIVLFAPVIAVAWRTDKSPDRVVRAISAAAAFFAVALPWYLLCALRNGAEFPRVFFLEHHFGRFTDAGLQHVQPWWFYFPCVLLLLYPWFPVLASVRKVWADPRTRTLAAVALFGFIFFSAARNKLPGYLLPLLPAACALMAIGYVRSRRPAWLLAACVALLGVLPLAAEMLPEAVAHGLRRARFDAHALAWPMVFALAGALAIRFTVRAPNRFAIASAVAAALLLWFQFAIFPVLDRAASARPLWRAQHPRCAPPVSRTLLYGLQYYAQAPLSPCSVLTRTVRRYTVRRGAQ